MELTKERAIDLTIELWEWLAETGKVKKDWPKWKEYGEMDNYCPLCHYVGSHNRMSENCNRCPLKWGSYGCQNNPASYYSQWLCAETITARKKYAKLFLGQLKELKKGIE